MNGIEQQAFYTNYEMERQATLIRIEWYNESKEYQQARLTSYRLAIAIHDFIHCQVNRLIENDRDGIAAIASENWRNALRIKAEWRKTSPEYCAAQRSGNALRDALFMELYGEPETEFYNRDTED